VDLDRTPENGSVRRAARQAHREYRSLARFAGHSYVAAHHAHELAGDGKAEPRAAEALRGQGICLREFLEQFRLLFGGQADAGIGDSKLDPQSRPSATLRTRRATSPTVASDSGWRPGYTDLSRPIG
jgi:hypothetical protein